MPQHKVEMTVEFVVRCRECNEELTYGLGGNGTRYDIGVRPCAKCLQTAESNGFGKGYEKGYDEAY